MFVGDCANAAPAKRGVLHAATLVTKARLRAERREPHLLERVAGDLEKSGKAV
jgi:hypothetical protein